MKNLWEYINQVDIGKIILEPLLRRAVNVLIILIMMYLVIKIGNKVIDKFVKRQVKSNKRFKMNRQKALTIGGVLKSILKYVTYFIGGAFIIGNLFSNISVAIAGFGSVALGFGAQDLVKDIINGFFILFEDQYGIGDHITVTKYEGIVETIGIRTTMIRDFNGDIHLIPNGLIHEITNHSRGSMRFLIDVDIAYEEDIDKAITCIKQVCKDFDKKNNDIVEPTEVLGVEALGDSRVTIRIMGKTKPLSQWNMERELRKKIKNELDEKNIEIPYKKVQIIKRGV